MGEGAFSEEGGQFRDRSLLPVRLLLVVIVVILVAKG